MPSSLHAQITRSAISPRLAIRTFLNMIQLSALSRQPFLPENPCGDSRLGCPPDEVRLLEQTSSTNKKARKAAHRGLRFHFFGRIANSSWPYSIGWPLVASFFRIS